MLTTELRTPTKGLLKGLNRKFPKAKGGKIHIIKLGNKKQNKHTTDNLYYDVLKLNLYSNKIIRGN